MDHPLHQAVADRIAGAVNQDCDFIRDPACGGEHQLPLFVGKRKARDTRMCCVDLLVLKDGQVRCIVEIEESGFLPTKICGKFFQACLADYFIHNTQNDGPVPYADHVLFVQVLDGAACLRDGGSKGEQAKVIEVEIRKLLPLNGLTDYRLFFVNGPDDQVSLDAVSTVVSEYLAEQCLPADGEDAAAEG